MAVIAIGIKKASGGDGGGGTPVSGPEDSGPNAITFSDGGSGSVTYNENSKIGSATLKLTDTDQWLESSEPSSDFDLGTAFTIGFWMRFDPKNLAAVASNGGASIISNYQAVSAGESTDYDGYEVRLTDQGYVEGRYYRGTSSSGYSTGASTTRVDTGAWYHVVFQRNDTGEGGQLSIFVNGVLENSDTLIGNTITHNTVTTNPFTIGARAGSTLSADDPFVKGTIDELEVIDGVSKYSLSGFTPPTTAGTSTSNHVILMHFDSDSPEPTIWYDVTDNNYWSTGGEWSGTYWFGYDGQWSAQYGWQNFFRPEQFRIQGTVAGSGTIKLTNNDDFTDEFVIASSSPASDMIMDTTFESDDSGDDLHYLKFMYLMSQITHIQVDAEPIDPMSA